VTGPELPWWHRALCREVDADLFFADREDVHSQVAVVKVCALCEVQQACLDDAIGVVEQHGIRAGMSARKRRAVRGERERAA
jgi:hypothetical protein